MSKKALPRTVLLLGLTSLFTDVSSEMILPLLPALLLSMNAGAAVLGLVEGVADAVSSFLKLGAGALSDKTPRKKPLVATGYAIATFVRPLMALALSPQHVLLIRLGDRVGKGIRTAPRDAMIAAAAPENERGRAFGFHRAMDHTGAVLGPLVATALLFFGWELRDVFVWALVPGVIALVCVLSVREEAGKPAKRETEKDTEKESSAEEGRKAGTESDRSFSRADRDAATRMRLYGYLGILTIFSLGNASDAFLLYRATELGVPVALIPLLWAVLHVSKVASSWLGGSLADRLPRARVIAAGWLVYAGSYLALGLATESWHAWIVFVIYGGYHGLSEPAEKALVADLAPATARGRAFGFYNFVLGITAIPAGLLTGWLWDAFTPLVALGTVAGCAAASAALILVWSGAVSRSSE